MQVGIMIEGQNGLNWQRWQRIARAVEDLGFFGLFRSDHFTNANPPDLDSLELWTSLTWLAGHTQRIQFGSMVTPMSYRDPVMTARMARDVDDLSGGRLVLGVGAGWQEREHANFGYALPGIPQREARLREGLEVITRLLRSDRPVDYDGTYFHLHDAILLPRPARPGGPPILIGGNGPKRTLPLAAQYADEWNAVLIPAARVAELNKRMDELVAAAGRKPQDVRRSLMTGVVFGRDDAEVERKLQGKNRARMEEQGLLIGTPARIREQLEQVFAAGAQRVMLQWLDLDDLDGLQGLARAVLA